MEVKSQKGQALVFTAFGLLILMGIMGLAIDMGHLRSVKRDMQTAADAAAIAAAGEIDYGDWNNAGLNASSKNGYANGTNGVTVTITHPPASPIRMPVITFTCKRPWRKVFLRTLQRFLASPAFL